MSLLDFSNSYIDVILDRVVSRVRPYVENNDKYMVSWSGGKDSTALLLIMNRYFREKLYALYIHIAGNTHYSNVQFINYVANRLGLNKVVIRITRNKMLDKPKLPEPPALIHLVSLGSGHGFLEDLKKYGFPFPGERSGMGLRWCTSIYKLEPLDRVMEYYRFRIILSGVKASDSTYRRRQFKRYGYVRRYSFYMGIDPLYDLTNTDIWYIIKSLDPEIYTITRTLYKKYGGAINCMICPFTPPYKIIKIFNTLEPHTREAIIKTLQQLEPKGWYGKKKLNKIIETIRVIHNG